MADYSSGTGRSYSSNPFAGSAGGGKTQAYATGLRSYARNPMAGTGEAKPMVMAEHLSRSPDLDPDIAEAYKFYKANNPDPSGQNVVPDIDRAWRLSPKSPMFQPGYQHHGLIQSYASELRNRRRPEYAEEQRQIQLGYEQPGQGGT